MARFSLMWQVFVGFGLLIVLALGVLGLVGGAWMERAGLQAVEERLRGKALFLEELARTQKLEDIQQRLNALHRDFGTRITLVAPDGKVIAESDRDDLEALDNHGQRPEIVSARSEPFGMATRYSVTTRQNMMYVARQLSDGNSPVAFVRVALSVADVERDVAGLLRLVWSAAALTALLTLALAWWLARRVAQPVQELRLGAEAVAGGEFGHKVYIDRKDELGALAQAFNQMSARLAQQFTQLDQDRQQLRAVLSSMVEGVIAVDAEQTILFANERAGQLLEFNMTQAIGRKLWEIVRQRPMHDLVQRLLTSSGPANQSLEWTAGQRHFTMHAAPLPGEPVRGAVIVLHDITEMRRLERVRQEFVANVSHELKTPLSVIVACAETLQSGAVDDVDNRGKFLERITSQSQRLLALIMDMISLARIESGEEKLEPQMISLEEAAHACAERLQERARAKQQRLETVPPAHPPEGGVTAWADAEALSHILDNLVDNAIKYTPERGMIQLHWWAEDGKSVLEVRDNGIGIPQSELPRIFERFYRVDKARSREVGGTGLGLSIVKHLVQALNGTVQVASDLGEGTCFTVTLPAGPQ